jgi:hypothetical protein
VRAADGRLPRGLHPRRHGAGVRRRRQHRRRLSILSFLEALPGRLFGTVSNVTLVAVPLFVLMGVVLEKSRVAEELLDSMAALLGRLRGGLAISVVLVGALLAASTGIVGATVVTMGLLSLPSMLRAGYADGVATGTICATGTLGQIIPPSIALVLLGDILSSAYQQAQLPWTYSTRRPCLSATCSSAPSCRACCWWRVLPVPAGAMALLRPQQCRRRDLAMSWGELLRGLLPPLAPDRHGARVHPRRRRHTDGGRGRRRHGCVLLARCAARCQLARLQEVADQHARSYGHGVHDPHRRGGLLPGVPRLWRRGADPGLLRRSARRRCSRRRCW